MKMISLVLIGLMVGVFAFIFINNVNASDLPLVIIGGSDGNTTSSGSTEWDYNMSTHPLLVISNNNDSWISTYNATYDALRIWGYNQTYTGGTYNSTYAPYAYNQTQASSNLFVNKTGDIMTGNLTVPNLNAIGNISLGEILTIQNSPTNNKLNFDGGVSDTNYINFNNRATVGYDGANNDLTIRALNGKTLSIYADNVPRIKIWLRGSSDDLANKTVIFDAMGTSTLGYINHHNKSIWFNTSFGIGNVSINELNPGDFNMSGKLYVGPTSENVNKWLYNQTLASGWIKNTTSVYLASLTNKVGIGTTSPEGLLQVIGNQPSVYINSTGTQALLRFTGTGGRTILYQDNTIFRIYTGGANRIYIDSAGKTGFGGVTPSSMVHVTGNITANYVSGRNLLPSYFTSFEFGYDNQTWEFSPTCATGKIEDSTALDGSRSWNITNTGGADCYSYTTDARTFIEPGNIYLFSYYVRCSATSTVQVRAYHSATNTLIDGSSVGTTWTKKSGAFTTTTGNDVYFRFDVDTTGQSCIFDKLQLEKATYSGQTATSDWNSVSSLPNITYLGNTNIYSKLGIGNNAPDAALEVTGNTMLDYTGSDLGYDLHIGTNGIYNTGNITFISNGKIQNALGTGTIQIGSNSESIKIGSLVAASGNDYVCISTAGVLSVSNTGCT